MQTTYLHVAGRLTIVRIDKNEVRRAGSTLEYLEYDYATAYQ